MVEFVFHRRQLVTTAAVAAVAAAGGPTLGAHALAQDATADATAVSDASHMATEGPDEGEITYTTHKPKRSSPPVLTSC